MLELMTSSFLKKISEPGLEIDPAVFKKLLASDGTSNIYFGWSVAVSADSSTIVIGTPLDFDNGKRTGTAYIFTKQANGNYLQTQKLVSSDGAASDNFGTSVAISRDGSTVVIGAYYDDDKGPDSGSAYVFTKQANGSYLETQKLVASDGAAGDYFGYSVATSGDGSIVIVGAYRDGDRGSYSGSAYVYTKQADGNYLQSQKLLASDGAAGDYFGISVSISGDGSTIVVGAYWDDDKGAESGSAYIFMKQAVGSYLQSQKLIASDGVAGDYFGWSVAVSADNSTIVVGAPLDFNYRGRSGSAYMFTKQVNGSYLETHKLVPADGAFDGYFGRSVSVSNDGSTIVVGAPLDFDSGKRTGTAYIFTKQTDGSYLQTQKVVATDGAASDNFGYSVAISQTSVVVGAYNQLSKGVVYVY